MEKANPNMTIKAWIWRLVILGAILSLLQLKEPWIADINGIVAAMFSLAFPVPHVAIAIGLACIPVFVRPMTRGAWLITGGLLAIGFVWFRVLWFLITMG